MSIAQRLSSRFDAEVDARRRTPWRLWVDRLLPLLCSAALVLVLTWPIVRETNNYFVDWPVHLWILRHQGYSLLHDGRPSLYVHGNTGVFYPFFAFYGATLYTIGGLAVALLGGAGRHGYALNWVLAFIMAYGGWVWLGRMAGLGRWAAQAPPALFLTSPYFITLVYARGDWPESVAVCSMPLLVASGLSVLGSDRLRRWPAVTLVGASVLFTGSHNLTLLWGGSLLVVLAAALCACSAQARRKITRPGVLRVLGLVVPAVLINAWFLVPALAYQAQTVIAGVAYDAHGRWTVKYTLELLRQPPLFSLDPFNRPPYTLVLPLFSMAWVVLVGTVVVHWAWRTMWMRLLALLGLLVAGLVTTMLTHGSMILALPKPYVMIQYTYRLENYILLAIAGAVLVVLVLVRQAAPRLRAAAYLSLAAVVAISFAGARHQIRWANGLDLPPSTVGLWDAPTEAFFGDYVDGRPSELPAMVLPRLIVVPGDVRHDRVSYTAVLKPRELIDTNLTVLPELVHIDGAHIIGNHSTVNGDIVRRYAVLKVDDGGKSGPTRITISAAHPWPVVVGRILSLLGVLGVAANIALRRWGGHRRQRQSSSVPVD